jgi:hypothetical protein
VATSSDATRTPAPWSPRSWAELITIDSTWLPGLEGTTRASAWSARLKRRRRFIAKLFGPFLRVEVEVVEGTDALVTAIDSKGAETVYRVSPEGAKLAQVRTRGARSRVTRALLGRSAASRPSQWGDSQPLERHAGNLDGWQPESFTLTGGNHGSGARVHDVYVDPAHGLVDASSRVARQRDAPPPRPDSRMWLPDESHGLAQLRRAGGSSRSMNSLMRFRISEPDSLSIRV